MKEVTVNLLKNKRKEETETVGPALLPDNKMRLADGREIDIFPRKQMILDIDNTLRLDTTGEFLSFCRSSKQKMIPPETPSEEERQFFLDNVFFFVGHYEEILSDSRMFLAQVPVQNGLAYTGTGGFRYPTLGVYLEWWKNNGQTIVMDEEGNLQFYWFVSGSPMSGANACSVVNERGEYTKRSGIRFADFWKTFMAVNTRYDACKAFGEAYTLKQVKDMLSRNDEGDWHTKAYLNGYRWLITHQVKESEKARRQSEKERRQIKFLRMDLHAEELKGILSEYRKQKEVNELEAASLRARVSEAKAKLKQGELTGKEYQQHTSPLKKKIETLLRKAEFTADSRLWEIFKDYKERVDLSDLIAWEEGKA